MALIAQLALAVVLVAAPAPGRSAERAQAPGQLVSMTAHEQHLLMLAGAPSRVAIGDPTVVDAKVLSTQGGQAQVLLVANKPGATEVRVWVRGNPVPLRWSVRVSGGVQHALESTGMPLQAPVAVDGDRAVITGRSDSLLAHQRSVDAAQASVGAGKTVDVSTVSSGEVVQVQVKVVELSRTVMKDVGLNLSAGGGGPWSGSATLLPSLSNGFSLLYNSRNFSAELGLLEQNGMARVLAEPTLVALSGQSASFLAGGEIPVPQSSGLGAQTVTYKPYGIGLTVSPTVLSRNRIALKVAPEASELDYTNAVKVVSGDQATLMPALRTRRADTMIELGDGESFVISGLVSRETLANVNKLPLLGDLPIIGAFFRSVQYSQEDKELVIVVTPHLVRPFAKGTALPLPGARQEARDTSTNAWGYYLLGPASGQQMPGFSR